MAISSDMFRGHTETFILNILSKGDNYGYEITKQITEKSEGNFQIKDATIYTAFRRMEEDGLIETYWGDGLGGARRRYYHITKKGSDIYKQKQEEWDIVSRLLTNLISK